MINKTLLRTQDSAVEPNLTEELFETLFNSLQIGVYIVQDGKFVFANPQFLTDTGFTEEELIGTTSLNTVHPEDRQFVRDETVKRLKGEKSSPYEFRTTTKDGKTRIVIETMASIQYQGKRAALGSHMDITERKRAEAALKESEKRFQDIVLSSADWIWEVDGNGRYTYASGKVKEILGYDPDEIIGKTPFELMPEEEAGRIGEVFKKIASEKKPILDLENWNLTKQGEKICLLTNGVPILGEKGELLGYRGVDKDITERKRAEQALADEATRRRILIDQSRDGIVVLDQNGNVYEANQRFAEMLGYSPEEVRDLSVWDWEFQFPREQVQEMIRTVDEKGDHFETRHRRKDGTIYDVEISTNGAVFGGQKLIFCVCRDITERKRAEQVLERLSQQLQARVSELEAFSYGIAHDLRSPLLSIEGFSRLLRDDIKGQKIEKVEEDIRLLESGVRKIQQFFNRTLEYSRAGYQVKQTNNVSFGTIVKEVLTELTEQVHSTGATVSVAETFPSVRADRIRISQALTNLIQNSIKYRDKTRPLKIEIGFSLSKDETVFFVRDNGIGIDEAQTEKVFDLFYRGTADGEGSGVGLAIVKRIIEAHGGRVWAESQAGKGTTMCFTLPQRAT